MCTTPVASSAKAAPRRHSPRDVFLAVRRRVSRPCSRMQSLPTATSLMRSHFGRDFEADKLAAACVETVTTLLPDGAGGPQRPRGPRGLPQGSDQRPPPAL